MKRLFPIILLAALAFAPVSAALAQQDASGAEGSSATEEQAQAVGAGSGSRMGLSQGVDRLLMEVHERQKELEKAEREVARREAAVLELEAMIEERIADLESDRAEVETRIAEWEAQDGDRIKKLSKVYAELPPAKAARLLSDLELDLAVSVLSRMKQKNSAEVLTMIAQPRALTMSRRMVRPLAESPDAQAGARK